MLVSAADMVARAKATIRECSIMDVKDCLGQSTLLIDIRQRAEFQRGHLPGAMLLPRGLLEFEIHGLVERMRPDPDRPLEEQPIVLYCGTGGRSVLAAETLATMGYRQVRSMAGGIVAWTYAGLPVQTPGQAS